MSLAIQYHMKRKKMAKGGEAVTKEKAYAKNKETGHEKGVHGSPSWALHPGKSEGGIRVRESHTAAFPEGKKFSMESAKETHKEKLSELKSMPKPKLPMAEGGEVCMHCGGAMPGYAEGGEVDNLPVADFEPNQFDYLDTHDGEEAEDDLVSRVMKKRKRA